MMHPSNWIHVVADEGRDAVAGEVTPRETSVFRIEDVSEIAVVIRHLCVRWFKRPQGLPSGVCTGHKKPTEVQVNT